MSTIASSFSGSTRDMSVVPFNVTMVSYRNSGKWSLCRCGICASSVPGLFFKATNAGGVKPGSTRV